MTSDETRENNHINESIDIRAQLDAMTAQAWALRYTDPERALVLSEEALQRCQSGECETYPYYQGMAANLTHLGYLNSGFGHFELALRQLFKARSLCDHLQEQLPKVEVLLYIGNTYGRIANYPESLNALLRALKLAQKLGTQDWEAQILKALGNLHNFTGDFQKALDAFENALQRVKAIDNLNGQGRILNDMAVAYLNHGEYGEALRIARQSLRIARKSKDTVLELYVLDTLGHIQLKLQDYTRSRRLLQRSLELARQLKMKHSEAETLLNLGKVEVLQGFREAAFSYLQAALGLAEKIQTTSHIVECHRLFADLYEQDGDIGHALKHFKEFHRLKEAIFDERTAQRLKTLQVLHDTETAKKEAEIHHLKNVVLEQEISERREAEAALQKTHQELQKKNKQLEALSASKDKFFSIISHDLKNSFTALLCSSELLVQKITHYTPAQIKVNGERIYRSAEQLYALLENLLTWSRIQRGVMQYDPCSLDVAALLRENIRMCTARAEQKKIRLYKVLSPEIWAYADYRMIHTVVRNLLTNALKYTGDGGTIRIEAFQREKLIEISITDTGRGFDADTLEQLFCIDTHHTETGSAGEKGTGLGLILCKELVEKNGGALWAESEPGQGATFHFTIPYYASHDKVTGCKTTPSL